MGADTKIGWTTHTANFWFGCQKISDGCKNCYADTLTKNRMGLDVFGPTVERQPAKAVWANLLKWDEAAWQARTRQLVFVMSLGDFLEDRPEVAELRARAWDLMAETRWLDYQILTKRPENYATMLPSNFSPVTWPHVWCGASIENNDHAWRADLIRPIPARVRFLSLEPLIGPLPDLNLRGIHWAIVGGESGSGYRQMDLAWVDPIAAACEASGTAFFFKQSAAPRTEQGIEYRGRIARAYPDARLPINQPFVCRRT